jgi:hypothetical protein
VNYEESFALVAKMTAIRTIILIIASQGWLLHKIDIKNTFFHGDLKRKLT